MAERKNGLLDSSWTDKIYYILHFGYYLPHMLKCFFSNPIKEEKHELNVLDQIQTLIETGTTDEIISKCEELSQLHRIIENTKARRRLEKWSLRVIVWYLLAVLVIVVSNYYHIDVKPFGLTLKADIPESIMITILSTTTVNIIGLGLIVLRGHFLANETMGGKDGNNDAKKNS